MQFFFGSHIALKDDASTPFSNATQAATQLNANASYLT
jgi:hypothetical protein